jgi:hypothetical protein
MSYPETKIQTNEIHAALLQIVKFVGKEFIRDVIRKTETSKTVMHDGHKKKKYGHLAPATPHPLAELWKKGFANYQALASRNRKFSSKFATVYYSLEVSLSPALLELFDIGCNLKEIENIPIISETGAIIEIEPIQFWQHRLVDSKSFEKAVYEIRVGASMKKNGYNVAYIKEGKDKTPDLLIEKNGEKAYVECKHKDKKSHRDQLTENLWSTMVVKELKLMDEIKKNYSVVVKANADLASETSNRLGDFIGELIAKSDIGTHEYQNFEITLKPMGEFEKVEKDAFLVDLKQYGIDMNYPTLFVYQHADVKFSSSLEMESKNRRAMVFASTQMSDRVKGILDSFDTAYKQIPESGAGVIYIEINKSLYKDSVEISRDLSIVRKKINGKLNVVSRVNAVILTVSSYFQKDEKAFYTIEMNQFKNLKPLKTLSSIFLNDLARVKIR